MANATITVPEIHCGHCKTSIEGALEPLEGVHAATVDIDSHTVSVSFDDGQVDLDKLVSAIEEQGYQVS